MPRKVKVVNINDDSTYGDVAEAIVENEKAENEPDEETKTEEVVDPEPPKPKARAKRVPIPKAAVADANTGHRSCVVFCYTAVLRKREALTPVRCSLLISLCEYKKLIRKGGATSAADLVHLRIIQNCEAARFDPATS